MSKANPPLSPFFKGGSYSAVQTAISPVEKTLLSVPPFEKGGLGGICRSIVLRPLNEGLVA